MNDQRKWYEKPASAIILLMLLFPVGLYLLWKYKHFSDGVRIAITGIASFYAVTMCIILISMVVLSIWNSVKDYATTNNVSTTQTEKKPSLAERFTEASRNLSSSVQTISATSIPEDEAEFIKVILDASSDYSDAANDLKRSLVRPRRKENIRRALSGKYKVANWLGAVDDIGTTDAKNAYLSVRLDGKDIRLRTNMFMSDDHDRHTLILSESKLFNIIAELTKGQKIRFSGTFFADQADFVHERSVTLDGCMQDPEFIFKFTAIGPPGESLQEAVETAESTSGDLQSVKGARALAVGTWTYVEPGEVWLKYVFGADGRVKIYSASPSDDDWGGVDNSGRWEVTSSKFRNTGERYYAISLNLKSESIEEMSLSLLNPAIFRDEESLELRNDVGSIAYVLTKGDRNPFSK